MTNPRHQHDDLDLAAGLVDPTGRPVDHRLLGQFMSAAFDGCVSCQDPLLTLLCEDPVTTARLVEVACVSTQLVAGGLPPIMINPGPPGTPGAEFARLARLGADTADLTHAAMFAACEHMTVTERRAAANTAADILIGHMTLFGG